MLDAKRQALLSDKTTQKKPEAIRPQIVEGQLKKWFSRSACSSSRSATGSDGPPADQDAIATIGENIRVRRFTRYELGEEL